MTFKPFSEAKDYVRTLKLKNPTEWHEYCKSGKKPGDIPAHPEVVYRGDWKGLGYWLGTDYVTQQSRRYRSFKEAREFARSLGLKNSRQWREL